MISMELLEFMSGLQNEIQLFEVDQECSQFDEGDAGIIDKMRACVALLERIFPMVQVVDEVTIGMISPKLFWKKWEKIKMHYDFPDDEDEVGIDDAKGDVNNLLSKFGSEGEAA